MRRTLESFFSGEITVEPTAWHFQAYKWWLNNSRGNRSGYRENFCHYVRVVLIWVPLIWFFRTRIYKAVCPWMIVATVSAAGSLAYAYTRWPEETFSWIRSFGIGGSGGFAWMIASHGWQEANKRWNKRPQRILLRVLAGITSPIWILPYVLFKSIVWFKRHVLNTYGMRFVRWFFLTRKWVVVSPWLVTLVVLLSLSLIFLGVQVTLGILGIIGIGLLGTLFSVFVLIICEELISLLLKFFRWRRQRGMQIRIQQPTKISSVVMPRATSTIQMAGQLVLAKKRKICPYINLPQEERRSEA